MIVCYLLCLSFIQLTICSSFVLSKNVVIPFMLLGLLTGILNYMKDDSCSILERTFFKLLQVINSPCMHFFTEIHVVTDYHLIWVHEFSTTAPLPLEQLCLLYQWHCFPWELQEVTLFMASEATTPSRAETASRLITTVLDFHISHQHN